MEKYTLIIAVENYQDKPIPPVPFAEADAQGISEALEMHGFDCEMLLSTQATKTTVESRLRYHCGIVTPEDYLVIFYAGHGFANNDHNYITAYDTQSGDLPNTSISLQNVMQTIRESKCERFVLLLDSCASGLEFDASMRDIISDMSDSELHDFFKDSEYNVGFASCKSDEQSYSYPTLSHGIWSFHIIEALNGNAESALERKTLLTARSLQAYLSQAVPRTLRKLKTGSAIQNPCLFGNLTREFLVADLEPILEAKKANAQPQLAQLKRALLRGTTVGEVKRLSGFKRGYHRLPDAVNNATESFVARIGHDEIVGEAEALFQEIRNAFTYRRNDIELSVDSGSASIICKDFDVDILLSLNPEDPSEYLLSVEASSFRSPNLVMMQAFNDVFAYTFNTLVFEFNQSISVEKVIDTIEELAGSDLSLDYPGDHTCCTIAIEGLGVRIKVTPGELLIVSNKKIQPIRLVKAFFGAQKLLVNTYNIKELPFNANQSG